MKYVLRSGVVIEIDPEDLVEVRKYSWHKNKRGYIQAHYRDGNGKDKLMYLHRFLTKAPKGQVVDHEDGNKLNNKRNNLRVCTQFQNMRNKKQQTKSKTSKYKGVYKTPWNSWRAQIVYCNKKIYLGSYKVEEDAALAYNKKAFELFGEFALLNKIEGGTENG